VTFLRRNRRTRSRVRVARFYSNGLRPELRTYMVSLFAWVVHDYVSNFRRDCLSRLDDRVATTRSTVTFEIPMYVL
jgi:hypothetical protein